MDHEKSEAKTFHAIVRSRQKKCVEYTYLCGRLCSSPVCPGRVSPLRVHTLLPPDNQPKEITVIQPKSETVTERGMAERRMTGGRKLPKVE
jgi:hypothetical protein